MNIASVVTRISEKVQGWSELALAMLPNFIAAVVILGVAWFAARLFGRAVRRALEQLSADDEEQNQIPGLVGGLVRVAVITGGLFAALGVLHLDKTVTSLLAGVGVIGIALGFAFQDMAANLISGLVLAIKKPFVAGQVIQYGTEIGKVLQIDLRDTKIQRFTGEVIILPNRKLLENELTNVTEGVKRRIDIEVGVAYGTDLERAQEVACEAVAAIEDVVVDEKHKTIALFRKFGASSIDMELRFWIDYADDPVAFLRARSEAIKAIKRGFDEAGIRIPFPIRTLDVPTETLDAVRRNAA